MSKNSEIAIKVENLSKKYYLGASASGNLRDTLAHGWHQLIGKAEKENAKKEFWALKDVSFEVKKGEVIGVIGRNGAGKSTLLKILSRITEPTSGRVELNGRVASLLEVGTGFHPELSGRENIFLNGALLGMTRAEIKRKFDEIIDFSGVEEFIDTPVKKYSSGMYVRLAFAVAAHLEPEILLVDEVLAVGDAEFQKKCLGKMDEVAKGGRTVVFVSHNMGVVKQLCQRGVLIEDGTNKLLGDISMVFNKYLFQNKESFGGKRKIKPLNTAAYFISWNLSNGEFNLKSGQRASFSIQLLVKSPLIGVEIGFIIRNQDNLIIFSSNHRESGVNYLNLSEGTFNLSLNVRLPLKKGKYFVDLAILENNQIIDNWISDTMLEIFEKKNSILAIEWQGILQENIDFNYNQIIG